MLPGSVVVLASFAYLGLLFAIAHYADKRADAGRSLIANPYIYALSLGVYATAWTFYGSVGRAASDGVGFLPIYIGPTLMIALWWLVMRKMVRISKRDRITSLADFIASRYGKSALLGGLVTVIAVVGIVPYISLQLKAISGSFSILLAEPGALLPTGAQPVLQDTALWVASALSVFTILFGTRHLYAAEHHEGMVAAIAFESLFKLIAFLAIGVYVTFGMYDGFGDLFGRVTEAKALQPLLTPFEGVAGGYAGWVWLTILSMLAIMFLPRQFQVGVIEITDERHLKKAIWLFPLYMLAINLFVLPIAFGGRLHFPSGNVDADTFVLALPIAERQPLLALLVFLGGLSAATGMVIVETIALSTMVCNDLVMPILLRWRSLRLAERPDLSALLLGIRRSAIVLILLLGYSYFRLAGEAYALVSIGLISFAAVAQFAPAALGGLFWRNGSRRGALAGLAAGFAVWFYTLLLPALERSGWLPAGFIQHGPFGIEILRPLQLFGLAGLDQITHAMIWSMLANIGAYVVVSLCDTPSAEEHRQANRFVDVFRAGDERDRMWRGRVSIAALEGLLTRFVGASAAAAVFRTHFDARGAPRPDSANEPADAALVHHVETQLAGAIGSASARIMMAATAEEEALTIDEVRELLDEAKTIVMTSLALEQKSRELEAATAELRAANERLKELDRMKDDFVSTVSHELRTPLTSIRAFAEILLGNPDVAVDQRNKFIGIIVKESERLSRLINQILDLAKLESGRVEWRITELDLRELVDDVLAGMSELFNEKGIAVDVQFPDRMPTVRGDLDRTIQVVVNLVSNAVKFCDPAAGRIEICGRDLGQQIRVDVRDNGLGIAAADQDVIFEKFRQAGDSLTGKPQGTGLGLPISRQIIEHLGGRLWVESRPGVGATFSFTLPVAASTAADTEPRSTMLRA